MIADQTRAYLYAGGTVVFWSTVASAFKLSLAHLSPAELLLWSSLASLLALGLLLGVTSGFAELRRWDRSDWLRSAGLGLLNPFLYYLVLFGAYDRLPAQEAQPLNFTWPIVLVLLSALFLGQRIRPYHLVAMGLSFAGVLIISTRGAVLDFRPTDTLGVGLALGSTLLWAGYWLVGMRDRRDPVLRLCINFVFGLVLVVLWVLLMETPRRPPLAGLAGAVYVGLFEMGLAFVFWLKALRLSRSTAEVSNLIYLVPFLSLLVIHQVVGEPIYPSTLLGLGLIVAGIVLQQWWGSRRGVA